jgi:hypothetical protein
VKAAATGHREDGADRYAVAEGGGKIAIIENKPD